MTIKTTKRATVLKPKKFDKYLEYTMDTSDKFWGVNWVDDEILNIYWGKILNDKCQMQTKTFEYRLEAIQWLREKVSEKLSKGYA